MTAEHPQAPPVVAVYGPGGVGKSALALRAAADVSDHYPDGQLYVDLQGSSPGLNPLSPDEALGRFLRSLGVPGPAVPAEPGEAAAKLRSLLADRRVLLMLDNAADTAQTRPLLPAGKGCAVLITSRAMLTGLDDARHIGLGVLHPAESVALLARLDATGRTTSDSAAACRLAELCGHLPLALRIAAARMTSRPDWPLTTFVTRLTDQRHRLDHLGHKDVSVRSCFEVSYQALLHGGPHDQDTARAFRLLGLPDGPDISHPIAARLLDTTPPHAEAVLDQLPDAQLIDNPAPGRYRMHDLLRLYARERAQQEVSKADRHAALSRVWRCYLSTTAQAGQLLRPGAEGPSEDRPGRDLAALSTCIAVGYRSGEALALNSISDVHRQLGHLDIAVVQGRRALAAYRELGDLLGQAQVLRSLGQILVDQEQYSEASACFEQSLAINRERADQVEAAWVLVQLGQAYRMAGRVRRAAELCREALTVSRRLGRAEGARRRAPALGQRSRRPRRLKECARTLARSPAHLRAPRRARGRRRQEATQRASGGWLIVW